MRTKEREEFDAAQMQQLLEILADYKLLYSAKPTKQLAKRIAELEKAIEPIGPSIKRNYEYY